MFNLPKHSAQGSMLKQQNAGIESAEKIIVIGDGAGWIWNISGEHFPGAIEIVDLYHAQEHLWKLGKLLFGEFNDKKTKWCKAREEELKRMIKLLRAFQSNYPDNKETKECLKEIDKLEQKLF